MFWGSNSLLFLRRLLRAVTTYLTYSVPARMWEEQSHIRGRDCQINSSSAGNRHYSSCYNLQFTLVVADLTTFLNTVSRTTGFWIASYGFKSQHLPIFYYLLWFWIFLDCLFSTSYQNYYSPIFVGALWTKKLTFVSTLFFFYNHYSFQDHNEFPTFSLTAFRGNFFSSMQQQFMPSTGKYSLTPKSPFYKNFRLWDKNYSTENRDTPSYAWNFLLPETFRNVETFRLTNFSWYETNKWTKNVVPR